MNVNEIVAATFEYESGGYSEPHYLPKADLPRFLEATRQLHYNPGINPYNKGPATKVLRVAISEFEVAGPYWWSTPGLGVGSKVDRDPTGARILHLTTTQVVDFVEEEKLAVQL